MKNNAFAFWMGSFSEGRGDLSMPGRLLDSVPVSASSAEGFANELISTALAGCYTASLTRILEEEGFIADFIETDAVVSIGEEDPGRSRVSLSVHAQVEGLEPSGLRRLAERARMVSPLLGLLKLSPVLKVTLSDLGPAKVEADANERIALAAS